MTTRIELTTSGALARVKFTSDRGVQLFSAAVRRRLDEVVGELEAQPDCRVVVFEAEGRTFIAGADIQELNSLDAAGAHRLAIEGQALMNRIAALPAVTVAAIHASCAGGGCELALACDLRVAADHATFGQPEVGLGIIPAAGATQRLPRLIGLGRAKQLILTGDAIDAQTALAWGLVTAVVPADELLPAARALAARILSRGPLAIRLARLALNASSRVDADSGLLIETLAQAICFESEDKLEGMSAFLEKRAPRFRG